MHQVEIGDKISPRVERYRLRETFEKGKHPAWGTLIVKDARKGHYRLHFNENAPDSP